jgi:hypothetical protein
MHLGPASERRHCAGKQDYFRVLAELGLHHIHWEALRKLFIDMLLHSPYIEVSEITLWFDKCHS